MALPSFVRIVEVGPRDGLQNEAAPVSTADRIEPISRLPAIIEKSATAISSKFPDFFARLFAQRFSAPT